MRGKEHLWKTKITKILINHIAGGWYKIPKIEEPMLYVEVYIIQKDEGKYWKSN